MNNGSDEQEEGRSSNVLSSDWEAALKLSDGFSPYSNLFSSAIRALSRASAEEVKSSAIHDLERVYRSPSTRAMIYYAIRTLDEEGLNKQSRLTTDRLTNFLALEDLQIVLALLYLTKRTKTVVTHEDVHRLLDTAQEYADLALTIGKSVEGLGIGTCLLAGVLRYLSFSMFMLRDRKKFKPYWIELRRTKAPYIFKKEQENWGCTHVQVGALILERMGFSRVVGEAYLRGCEAESSNSLDAESMKYFAAKRWLDSLMLKGVAPEITFGDQFLLNENDAEILEQRIDHILRQGSFYSWFQKSKKDISPDKTPQVYFVDLDGEQSDSDPEDS